MSRGRVVKRSEEAQAPGRICFFDLPYTPRRLDVFDVFDVFDVSFPPRRLDELTPLSP